MRLTRRTAVLGGLSLSLPALGAPTFHAQLSALEKKLAGRIGVFAARGPRTLAFRDAERFAYCSVFKWVLAAAVLRAVQDGKLTLSQRVTFGEKDLLEPSTLTRPHLADGGMTVGALCHAAVTTSDNTATMLLEPLVGGVAGLRAFTASLGDQVMRFDRLEPELNSNLPGDPRDTTSPKAMSGLLQQAFTSDVLTTASKGQLFEWMQATTTGLKRIRASVPEAWAAGDKTGTSSNGAANDVAVLRPPDGAPLYVTVFTSGKNLDLDVAASVIAEVSRLVVTALGR